MNSVPAKESFRGAILAKPLDNRKRHKLRAKSSNRFCRQMRRIRGERTCGGVIAQTIQPNAERKTQKRDRAGCFLNSQNSSFSRFAIREPRRPGALPILFLGPALRFQEMKIGGRIRPFAKMARSEKRIIG